MVASSTGYEMLGWIYFFVSNSQIITELGHHGKITKEIEETHCWLCLISPEGGRENKTVFSLCKGLSIFYLNK